MSDSPAKRRKLSPTTSIPLDAPTTPSRIPIPRNGSAKALSGRPSFASPTRASIARHNPQLLNRPWSSGSGSERPGIRGKNLQDVLAKALGEARPTYTTQSVITGEDREGTRSESTTQENEPPEQETQQPTTPGARSTRSFGGALSAKPRRMSRSPAKKLREPVESHLENMPDLEGISNPFEKRGLRRSPSPVKPTRDPAESHPELEPDPGIIANPFEKRGLRRSPSPVKPMRDPVESRPEAEPDPEGIANPFQKRGLRRSSPGTQIINPVESQPDYVPDLEGIANPFGKRGLRRSPSPVKPTRNQDESQQESVQSLNGIANPFEKKGLRRSIVPSQVEPATQDLGPQAPANVFRRMGLRRSPVSSQTVEPVQKTKEQTAGPPEFSTTPPGPAPAEAIRRRPPRLEQGREGQAESPIITEKQGPLQRTTSQAEEPVDFDVRDRASATTSQIQEPLSLEVDRQALAATSQAQEIDQLDVDRRQEVEIPIPTSQAEEPAQLEADRRQEIESPVTTRTRQPRVSPHFSQVAKVAKSAASRHNEEPELPPTPTQRGIPDPVVTTPPSGIHDTPSKRARRRKALAAKIKSSPLKPRDPPPQEPTKDAAPVPEPKKEPCSVEAPRRRKSARFLIPEDPYASKKKERDDLLKELRQLQADVTLANQENERFRLREESRKNTPASPANPDEFLAMLARATASGNPVPKPNPRSIFKSVGAFLPFRSRRRAQPLALPVPEKPLPSHLPIELVDPLPYLQAFSALTYTSTITLLPQEATSPEASSQESEQPILQHHLINASHPSGLFGSQISMTVATSTLSISSLDILKLDASAESELGTFVRQRASAEGPLGKDISVVCWAMGRWVEVAISRARFWCAVENEFGSLEARSKALQKGSRKRKRKRQGTVVEDDDDVPVANDEDDEVTKHKWTRKQILPHMGRTSMGLVNDEVELRIEWKIGFDWTGEVDSSISANARLPRNCEFAIFHFSIFWAKLTQGNRATRR
jgi:hypothetical protein